MLTWIVTVLVGLVCLRLWTWWKGRQYIKDLNVRHVLITGCDTGFGNLLARTLDTMNIRVFACCLTERGMEDLNLIGSERMRTIHLDVTSEQSIEMAVTSIKTFLPQNEGLWGLVNNAGISLPMAPFEQLDQRAIRRVIDVNLFGVMGVTRAFLPLVRKARGRIVNVSSAIVFCMIPGMTAYGISKAGVEAFSDCLRRELYRTGVTVHLIEPANFNTNILSATSSVEVKTGDDEVKAFYGGSIEKHVRSMKEDFSKGDTDLMKVIKAQIHALMSVKPECRYVVGGLDAQLIRYIHMFLPEFVLDATLGFPTPGLGSEHVFSLLHWIRRD